MYICKFQSFFPYVSFFYEYDCLYWGIRPVVRGLHRQHMPSLKSSLSVVMSILVWMLTISLSSCLVCNLTGPWHVPCFPITMSHILSFQEVRGQEVRGQEVRGQEVRGILKLCPGSSQPLLQCCTNSRKNHDQGAPDLQSACPLSDYPRHQCSQG